MELILQSGLLEWNKQLFVFIALISTVYWLLSGFINERGKAKIQYKHRIYFLLGLLVFYVCWGSPLYGFAHLMFSAHMLQMSLLYFLVTPLLFSGIQIHLFYLPRRFQTMSKVWTALTSPIVSFVLFNGLFIVYHIPKVMDTIMLNSWLYYSFHILLAYASFCVWQTIVGRFSIKKLAYQKRKHYIMANTLVLLPVCLLLFFSTLPYRTFTDVTAQFNMFQICFDQNINVSILIGIDMLPTDVDQKLGGAIMLALHKMSFLVGEYIQPKITD
ncbi:cytochrome c oxidase assembly protein [Chengkuizengella marina]|nr:cytochrome c oxidase assembly protein [Chengkuizengella marina]